MAYSGGVGLPGPARPGVAPQVKAFVNKGGWSVLGNPANNYAAARGYQAALMNTAKRPQGPTGPVGHPPAVQPPHPSTPGPPAPPATPGAAATPATPAPQASPFDSTYYANVAANQFKVGNDINRLNLQGTQNDTALQTALGQLAYQQPRDSLKLEEAANRGGGLYSQSYDAQQADLGHQYFGKQQTAQTTHDTTRDKLASQIAGLQAGIPYYNSQQEADSASRLAAAAAKDPTLGQGTGGLNTQPGRVTGGIQQGINNAAAKKAALPPAKIPNTTPPQVKAFVNKGGWSVLGNPANNYANARNYGAALMDTAKNPHGVLATAIAKKGKK